MDKTVLITGGAKRLGAHIAEHMASQGWSVALHCNASVEEGNILAGRLSHEYKIRATVVSAPLDDASAVQRLIPDAAHALGRPILALVNNASTFEYDDVFSMGENSWQKSMDVNFRAPVFLAQQLAAQPCFGEGESANAIGFVVNVLDQKLFNLNPDFFSYTLSKMGLQGATALMARALAPKGIRVNAVAPGLTLQSGDQSPEDFKAAHCMTPLGKSSEPQDIARAVAYFLSSPATTGQTLVVDGGQHMLPLERDVMYLARST